MTTATLATRSGNDYSFPLNISDANTEGEFITMYFKSEIARKAFEDLMGRIEQFMTVPYYKPELFEMTVERNINLFWDMYGGYVIEGLDPTR